MPTSSALCAPIHVELLNSDSFWRLRALGNEQVVAPAGRCFFPVPEFSVSNLDKTSKYKIGMFFRGIVDKEGVSPQDSKTFHPFQNSVESGNFWMKNPFAVNVKTTNNEASTDESSVYLPSQCNYVPVLKVQKVEHDEDGLLVPIGEPEEFAFDCAEFRTVTKYKNKEVAALKTRINKYATNCRLTGRKNKKALKTATGEQVGATTGPSAPVPYQLNLMTIPVPHLYSPQVPYYVHAQYPIVSWGNVNGGVYPHNYPMF
ncbi:unnamed protein product [Caenorhabditis sp. 36 PRJEB53466]|nr:unnamed protein product [Caenorhabditis sp. 36 PRJEB53466]